MTDSFGARLRRSREHRQLTIKEIAAQTKIKASLFEGLERDDVSRWPSGIFRRAFVRTYAEAIGLDPDSTLREFLTLFPDPAAPEREDGRNTTQRPVSQATTRSSMHSRSVAGGLSSDLNALHHMRARVLAAAWDLGVVLMVTLAILPLTQVFWMPLGILAICYYVGGLLVLGNSPGAHLFASRPPNLLDWSTLLAPLAKRWAGSSEGGSERVVYGDASRR